MKRTDAYVFTAYPDCQEDMMRIEELRKTIKIRNLYGSNLRVSVKGRLGKNSQFAHLYAGRHGPLTIKLEHSSRYDVYIHYKS